LRRGELGAGHAQVQVEGKITNMSNGDLLATFAERRRSSGAVGFKDLGGDAGPALIKHMIGEISSDINDELRSSFFYPDALKTALPADIAAGNWQIRALHPSL